MKIKKIDLNEIIDSNGDLIGSNSTPTHGSDLESQANNTTDNNVRIGTQPFRYDMLGRFGFTLLPFFEGENEKVNDENIPILKDLAKLMYDKYMETLEYYYRNPNKLKSDFRLHNETDFDSQPDEKRNIDYAWAKKIVEIIHPYLNKDKQSVDESKIVEDKVVDKKSEIEISKKKEDGDIRDKKIEKVADLINKLDKKDIDKLINLLERK